MNTRIAVSGEPWPGDPTPHDPDAEKHVEGFAAGDVIGVLAGLLLLGFFALQLQSAYYTLFAAEDTTFVVRAADMWANSAVLIVVLGLLPWLWVLLTRRGGWQGMLDYFGLRDPGRPILQGIGLGLLMVIALILLGLIMQAADIGQENQAIGPIQAILTFPLVLAISISAALGEEILFRGIIQKWIGLWPQAILFGLLHAYQGVFGIFITTLIALLFGYIIQKRKSLWIPIAAHFTFDFTQLGLLLIAPESI